MVKKDKKDYTLNRPTGVGLSLAAMDDKQFEGHLSRVLKRMRSHNVSDEKLDEAKARVTKRRQEAIVVA